MKRFLLSALMLLGLFVGVHADEPVLTFDFTTNDWNLPVASSQGIQGPDSYTATIDGKEYTISLYAQTKFYYNTSGYLMLGKTNSTLTLPAFDFPVTQIAVEGTSGASASVKQNIYVGNTAISKETTGAQNVTNEYDIPADYQAAGTQYTLKVTSNHNTQITKIYIYGVSSVYKPFDLGAASVDKENAYEDGAVTITFPEADNVDEAASADNTYSFTATVQAGEGTGAKTETVTGTSNAADGVVIEYPFRAGTVYNITIPANSVVLSSPEHEEAAFNEKPINIRISDAETETVTFDFPTIFASVAGNQDITGQELSSDNLVVDLVFDKGTGNETRYYANNTTVRAYIGNTFTISASQTISKIVLKGPDKSYMPSATKLSASSGYFTSEDASTYTLVWEGAAKEVTFTCSVQNRLVSIDVTYETQTDDLATIAAKDILDEELADAEEFLENVMNTARGVNIFQYSDGTLNTYAAAIEKISTLEASTHTEQGVYDLISQLRTAKKNIHPTMPKVDDLFLIQNTETGTYLNLSNGVQALSEGTPVTFHNILMQPQDYLLMKQLGIFIYHSLYIYSTPDREYLGYLNDLTLTNKQDTQWYVGVLGGNRYAIYFRDQVTAEPFITFSASDVASAGTLNGVTFAKGGLELTITDTAGKVSIDKNTSKFGTEDSNVTCDYRLKVGAKSSDKNYLTLTIPQDGTLKVYARTSSNSATDRNMVITQNGEEIFNQIVQEADAVNKIYPAYTAEVEAGTAVITYPTGALNFYGFELETSTPSTATEEQNYYLGVNGKKVVLGTEDVAADNDSYAWNILYYFAPEEGADNSESGESSSDPATSVNGVSETSAPVAIYSTSGAQLKTAQKGLNIVKMADGSTRKVLVK